MNSQCWTYPLIQHMVLCHIYTRELLLQDKIKVCGWQFTLQSLSLSLSYTHTHTHTYIHIRLNQKHAITHSYWIHPDTVLKFSGNYVFREWSLIYRILKTKQNCVFRVCQSVHHHTFNCINQQDAATSQVYYLSFKYSSTCFGHPHAHRQELQQLQ